MFRLQTIALKVFTAPHIYVGQNLRCQKQLRLIVSTQADFLFFCCSVEVKAAAWSPRGEKITGTQGHRDESVRGGAERKIGRKVSGFKKNKQWLPLNKTPEDVFMTTCLRQRPALGL